MHGTRLIFTLWISAFLTPAPAQHLPLDRSAAPTTAKALTNADILALTSANIDDSIILDKVRNAPTKAFDISVDGLKSLRAGNVSNTVIREMMSSATSLEAAAGSNDPSVIHPPGVYAMISDRDGSAHLLMLEHSRAMGDKMSGNAIAMAYGFGKMHTRQSLNGPKSPLQLEDPNPTFYLYIPEDTQSFGGSSFSARDFELVKLHVKDRTREVQVASMGRSGMGNNGVEDKTRQNITTNKMKPGVYVIKLQKPLKPGEYAFEHQLDGVFYDFGVIESR
jgi:hypothetical protein